MKWLYLPDRNLGLLLWILLALFCFRVGAQLLQLLHPVGFLPDFEHWQGGNLPYGLLFLSQLVIIYVCARTALGIQRATTAINRRLGQTLRALGIIYFTVMVVRLMLGLSLLSDSHWFSSTIPALFHLVLASFMIVTSQYHLGTAPAPVHEQNR